MDEACGLYIRKNHSRRAVALVLVLVLIGVATALTAALLGSASVRTLTSYHLVQAARTRALAESGLSEAAYFLKYYHVVDPQNPDGIWAGVSNRRLDETPDYYDVTVTADPTSALFFTVTSTARRYAQSTEQWVSTLRERVLVNRGFYHAFLSDRDLTIPAHVQVFGEVYCGGNLRNYGTINGNVQVGGTVIRTGSISGSVTTQFPALELKSCSLPNPLTYVYQGITRQATTINESEWNNITVSVHPSNNPCGVYVRYGNFELDHKVILTGTLIVTGQLRISRDMHQITPQPGFPALIAEGEIRLIERNAGGIFNGAWISKGRINPPSDLRNSSFIINGPLVFLGTNAKFDAEYLTMPASRRGSFVINQDITRASISGLFPPNPSQPRQVRFLSLSDE